MARPEPKPWFRAALGGLVMALGGLVLRVLRRRGGGGEGAARPPQAQEAQRSGRRTRSTRTKTMRPPSARKPAAALRPKVGRARVRTKPQPADPPPASRYWPPPAPNAPRAPDGRPSHGTGRGDRAAGRDEPTAVDLRSEAVGYEVRDTRAATVVKVMAVGVTVIATSIAGLFVFIGQSHRTDREAPPLTPQQLAIIVPPGPRLQDHPLHDIESERRRESDLLEHYAWTDNGHRTARIPIARAQALVIGRSLDPVPAPEVAPASTP